MTLRPPALSIPFGIFPANLEAGNIAPDVYEKIMWRNLDRALGLGETQLPTLLHLAHARVRLGKLGPARELLAALDGRRRELSQRDQDHLDKVSRMYDEAKNR